MPAGHNFKSFIKRLMRLGDSTGLSHTCSHLLGMAKGIFPNLNRKLIVVARQLNGILIYTCYCLLLAKHLNSCRLFPILTMDSVPFETLPFEVYYLHLASRQIVLIKARVLDKEGLFIFFS
uniref:Uncharacterized protein n=1 Tax=Myotis myotis TaxID=51298 RepID=A0A7J7V3I5_MYOMY|nr:hypothetical protein mMyoMyo1_008459 [Myotis myotis]